MIVLTYTGRIGRFWRGLGLAALIACGWSSSAMAACEVSIAKGGSDPAISFDPFIGEPGTFDFMLDVTQTGSDACNLGLAVASDDGRPVRTLKGIGSDLTYVVETTAGFEFQDGIDQAVPIGTSGPGTTHVTVRFRIPPGQMGAAGDFVDTIRLRLVDLNAANAPLGDDLTASVRGTIPGRAQVNLAGSTGPFNPGPFSFAGLDFGELATGSRQMAFVQIRATKAVTVTATSLNGGVLRRIGSSDPADAISYALSLDGNLLALASGAQSLPAAPPVSLDGESLPLVVELTGDPDVLPAGNYRDVVTISVVPN